MYPFRIPLLTIPELPPGTPESWLIRLQSSPDEPMVLRISAFRAYIRTRVFDQDSLVLVDRMLSEFQFEYRVYAYHIVCQLLDEGRTVSDAPQARPIIRRIVKRAAQEPRPELFAAALALRVGLGEESAREEAALIVKGEFPTRYAEHSQDRQCLGVLKRVAKGIVTENSLALPFF